MYSMNNLEIDKNDSRNCETTYPIDLSHKITKLQLKGEKIHKTRRENDLMFTILYTLNYKLLLRFYCQNTYLNIRGVKILQILDSILILILGS